jgi:hypothetical protein
VVFSALAKLFDRTTQHIGLEELDRLIRSPSSLGVVPILLHALASTPRCSPRLRGIDQYVSPHLQKLMTYLAWRLKDQASNLFVPGSSIVISDLVVAQVLRSRFW